MAKQKKRIGIQIAVWAIYWLIDIFKMSLLTTSDFFFFFTNLSAYFNLLTEVVVNLFFGTFSFYALILFVLPLKTRRIHIPRIIGHLLLVFLLGIALRRGVFFLVAEGFGFSGVILTNYKYFLVSSFDIFLQFGTYASLVWFFLRQKEMQKQILQKQLDQERLQNELLIAKEAVINAQINPHFLFNSLNLIHSKSMTSTNPEEVGQTILLLSDILRYSLKDHSKKNKVSINEELEHIKKLYVMNRIRFNEKHYMQVSESGTSHNHKIPPFLLLTFFENALKHGVTDDPENPLLLTVVQTEDAMEITLKNQIKPKEKVDPHHHFAIGKRYVENILKAFYENNYILKYINDGEFHTVHLKLYEKEPEHFPQ